MIELGISDGPDDPTEHRSYSSLLLGAIEAQAIGAGSPAAAWARSAACELAALYWSRGLAAAVVTPQTRRTAALTPLVLATIARRLARGGEYLALLDVRDGRLQLDEVWQWFVTGRPRRAEWMYRCTQSGPSRTETRTLPADDVLHVRYAWSPAQPWRGLSPAAFASTGAGLVGGIDVTLSGEANSPSGYVLPAADLGGDADDDDVDPFATMRAELAALRGGMTIGPTMKDALGLGKDAAPASDYDAKRFGFDPPEALEPLRRQALVDLLGAYGIPAPLVDEKASAAAYREAARLFRETTLPALGAIIAEQVGAAIGQPDLAVAFPKTPDIGILSRAVGSLVSAGVPLAETSDQSSESDGRMGQTTSARYRRAGRCVTCGRARDRAVLKCARCRVLDRRRAGRYRAGRGGRTLASRKFFGACVCCGHTLAPWSRRFCKRHWRAKRLSRQRLRRYRVRHRLCVRCAQPRERSPFALCAACRAMHRERYYDRPATRPLTAIRVAAA